VIRVLTADDHDVVRRGIGQLLAKEADLVVVGEARSGWEVLEVINSQPIDVVLLDISMPGPAGIELIGRLKREAPNSAILVFSMYADREIVQRAIKAGATGYVTKGSELERLSKAIRKVASGGRYLDDTLAEALAFDTILEADIPPHALLSDRQYHIMQLLVEGHSVKEIAVKLHLSVKTVSTHKTRILKKLGVRASMELLRYAIRHGLIQQP
jgi:DNA-binding NarL/FixJ family response regulator